MVCISVCLTNSPAIKDLINIFNFDLLLIAYERHCTTGCLTFCAVVIEVAAQKFNNAEVNFHTKLNCKSLQSYEKIIATNNNRKTHAQMQIERLGNFRTHTQQHICMCIYTCVYV